METILELPISDLYPIGTTFTVTNIESDKPVVVQNLFSVPLGETRTIIMTKRGWELVT